MPYKPAAIQIPTPFAGASVRSFYFHIFYESISGRDTENCGALRGLGNIIYFISTTSSKKLIGG
jgi:hypothetical protein